MRITVGEKSNKELIDEHDSLVKMSGRWQRPGLGTSN
jgi:hypothetical protein